MKSRIGSWQTAGFLFTSVAGTLLHFLYDLSGQALWAGLFSAVNESIWEHMKLIYFPMLLFGILEGRYVKDSRYWCVKLMGMLTALALIPVLYYTYTGALGVSADWFNITIFFIAAGAAYYLEAKLLQGHFSCPVSSRAAVWILAVMGAVFVAFTFYPPRIPLFADPLTGEYGIWNGKSRCTAAFCRILHMSCLFKTVVLSDPVFFLQ